MGTNLIETKHMKDKVFIDTNILIYFVSNDEPKKIIAKDILIKKAINIINSQVMQHNQLIDRKLRIVNPFV